MQTLLHTPVFGVPVLSDSDWQTEWTTRAAEPHAVKAVDEARWQRTQGRLKDVWNARQRFLPQSLIAKGGAHELGRALESTRELVAERNKPIYKSSFVHSLLGDADSVGLVVRPDFLVVDGESGWRMAEVVSGEITPADIFNLAMQVYVLEAQGLTINKASLIFYGAIWQAVDKTAEVRAFMPQVKDIVTRMKGHAEAHPVVLSAENRARDGSEFPLYELMRIDGKRDYGLQDGLAELGIFDVRQIPLTLLDLADLHKRQIGVTQTGVPYVNEASLVAGYKKYVWPVNYLDLETETYDMDGPNERHYTRQASNRIVTEAGEELAHDHFLDVNPEDPVLGFARWLVRSVNRHGDKGTIVVFWEGFEIQRFNELAQKILRMAWDDIKRRDNDASKKKIKLAQDILAIIPRIFDQYKLLSENLYFREQHGRSTIKVLQPLIVPKPELTYDDLTLIKNGLEATTAIIELIEGRVGDPDQVAEKIAALLVYCGVDTLAMKELDREVIDRYVREKVFQRNARPLGSHHHLKNSFYSLK